MKKRKLKKKVKLIIILIILIIVIFSSILFIKKNSFKIIYTDTVTINVGDKLPSISDYVDEKYINDVKRITFDVKDDNNYVNNTGTYTGTILFKDKSLKIKLIVIDNKKPNIDGNDSIIYYIGNNKESIYENFEISDNSKDKLDISLKGNYDLNKEGKYNISIDVKDKNDNEITKNITIFVVEKNDNIKYSISSNNYLIKTINGITYVDDILIVNKTYGVPSNFVPENLVTIKKSKSGTTVVDYVNDAFEKLIEASEKENLNIIASTAYRSYNFQSSLYNNYVNKDGKENADTYSARPGYSEHHTGLAIDVNDVSDAFEKTKESDWLKENAYKFGFILRYQKGKEEYTGYKHESWHIRYVGEDLAKKLYQGDGVYITLEEYFGIDSKYEKVYN